MDLDCEQKAFISNSVSVLTGTLNTLVQSRDKQPMAFQKILESSSYHFEPAWPMVREDGSCNLTISDSPLFRASFLGIPPIILLSIEKKLDTFC